MGLWLFEACGEVIVEWHCLECVGCGYMWGLHSRWGFVSGVGVECGDLHACPASLDSSFLQC